VEYGWAGARKSQPGVREFVEAANDPRTEYKSAHSCAASALAQKRRRSSRNQGKSNASLVESPELGPGGYQSSRG
jgi:hypothetical protein